MQINRLLHIQAHLDAFEMKVVLKYYEKWNIYSWGANVLIFHIFKN